MNDHMAINCPSSPEAFCPEWLANPLIPIAELDRPSISKVYVEMDDGSSKFPITQRTIVCGDGETSTMAVECIGVISKLKYKTNAKTAVFEVIYKGEKCIAKCWIPESVFEYVLVPFRHPLHPPSFRLAFVVLESSQANALYQMGD